jgi:hypothetical protein
MAILGIYLANPAIGLVSKTISFILALWRFIMAETPQSQPPRPTPEEFHWAFGYLREDIQDVKQEVPGVNQHVNGINQHIDETNQRVNGTNQRIDETNRRIDSHFTWLITTMVGLTAITITVLKFDF